METAGKPPSLDFTADPYNKDCPSRQVLDMIGDKWTVLLIGALERGPVRFSDLRALVGGITGKILTEKLRALERDGLVARNVFHEVPRRVEYSLTPLGQSLLNPLERLREWAETHVKKMILSGQRFVGPSRQRPL